MVNLIKSEVTDKIIKAAIEVHRELGPHYLEVVYQRALAIELTQYFEDFSREIKIPIHYKGKIIDTRRADFLVDDVLVEIKAKGNFEPRDHEQILSYLKSANLKVGLLLNFGADRVEISRKVN